MPLDDKVEKMNGGVYGVLKVLLGKAGNNIAGAVNYLSLIHISEPTRRS